MLANLPDDFPVEFHPEGAEVTVLSVRAGNELGEQEGTFRKAFPDPDGETGQKAEPAEDDGLDRSGQETLEDRSDQLPVSLFPARIQEGRVQSYPHGIPFFLARSGGSESLDRIGRVLFEALPGIPRGKGPRTDHVGRRVVRQQVFDPGTLGAQFQPGQRIFSENPDRPAGKAAPGLQGQRVRKFAGMVGRRTELGLRLQVPFEFLEDNVLVHEHDRCPVREVAL